MIYLQTDIKNDLITVLPIFLIGLGITCSCLIAGGACYDIPSWRLYSGIAFGSLIALFIGILGIIGLMKRIPVWSILWVSISMIGFLALINFASSFGLPNVVELVIIVLSVLVAIFVFYWITKQSWQIAGLFGIGLSTALSLILFFMATNISHNKIKIGYYDLLIGIVMSGLIILYLKGNNLTKILILIAFLISNGLMIYVFDLSMQRINEESQIIYLIIFSSGLLFSGIFLHFSIRLIKKIVKI